MDRLGEVGSVDCWEKEDPFLIKINIHDIQGEWFESGLNIFNIQ